MCITLKLHRFNFEITRLKKMDNSGLGKKLNENFSPAIQPKTYL